MRKIVVLMSAVLLALTACAAEAESVELTQTIDGDLFDTSVTVTYPDGWFATSPEDEDIIRVANQSTALGETISFRRDGDVSGGVTLLLPDALGAYELEADDSMTAVARALADNFVLGAENVITSSPTSFNNGDQRGALVTGTARGQEGASGRVSIAVITLGDVYGVVTLATFGEDFDTTAIARLIAESLVIN